MIEYRITFKGISDPDQYAPEGHHSDPFEGSFKEALVHLRAGRKTAQDCGLPANHARLEVRTVSCWEGPGNSLLADLENALDQHAHIFGTLLQRLAEKDDCPFWKKEDDS